MAEVMEEVLFTELDDVTFDDATYVPDTWHKRHAVEDQVHRIVDAKAGFDEVNLVLSLMVNTPYELMNFLFDPSSLSLAALGGFLSRMGLKKSIVDKIQDVFFKKKWAEYIIINPMVDNTTNGFGPNESP